MAKMADSDSESESDINKKKLLLREKQRKKFLCHSPSTKTVMLVTTISWEVASPAAFLAVWENGKLPGTKKRVYGKMTYYCGIHAIILQRNSNPRFRSHEKTTNACQSRTPEFHHSREQPPYVLTTVRPPHLTTFRPRHLTTVRPPHVLTTVRRGTGEAHQAFPPWHPTSCWPM